LLDLNNMAVKSVKDHFPYLTADDWFWVEMAEAQRGFPQLLPGQQLEPTEVIVARLDRFCKFKEDLRRYKLPVEACARVMARDIYLQILHNRSVQVYLDSD